MWLKISTIKWNLLTFIALIFTINYIGSKDTLSIISNYIVILLFILAIARLFIVNFVLALIISVLISLELTFFIVTGERVSITVLSASIDTDLSITSGSSQPFLIKSIPFILVFSFLFIMSLVEIRRLNYKKYFTLLFCVALVTIASIYYKLEVYKAYLVEWGGYTENDYGSKKLYF